MKEILQKLIARLQMQIQHGKNSKRTKAALVHKLKTAKKLLGKFKRGSRSISVADLYLILAQVDGTRPSNCWILTSTDARLVKKNRANKEASPFANDAVRKLSKYDVTINTNYTNSMNTLLEKAGLEADFEAELNWHKREWDEFNGCVGMKRKGESIQRYLIVKDNNITRLSYLVNDNVATAQQEAIIGNKTNNVPDLLPLEYESKYNGIAKPNFKTLKLESIVMLGLKGEIYKVSAN